MKKLTLLLGTIIGLTTVSNVTYCSHNSQGLVVVSSAITDGKTLIGQTFDGINKALIDNLGELKDSEEQTNAEVTDSLYEYVFGTDFLSMKHFGEDADLDYSVDSKILRTLFKSINRMHSIPLKIYENYNLSMDKTDKLNIEENKNFIKEYLRFLFTVRNKKMLEQNKEHWIFNRGGEKHIETIINLIADILVDDKIELDCNNFDFSNNSHRLDYAVRLVAQQIFANVQEGYQKCIKDENLTKNLNYMVGERSIPRSDVGERSGDFFIGVKDLNRWLSIKKLNQGDDAPDFVFNPNKDNLIPEKFYEKAFTDEKSETNFLGLSLLKCCLEGVVKREINKERNKNEIFIENTSNSLFRLESAERLLNTTSKFLPLLERMLNAEKESVALKQKYEGNSSVNDKSKQGEDEIDLPKIDNPDVGIVIQDLLYEQVQLALKAHGNGDQLGYSDFEDVVRDLKNGISLVKSSINKAITNETCNEAEKLIDTYGNDVYEQLKNTQKTIDKFFTRLFPSNKDMEIKTLKRLFEDLKTDCEKKIKGFLSDMVNLNGSIYNGDEDLFDAVKMDYYELVKDVVIYFVDFGLVDEHKSCSMILGPRQDLLIFKDLIKKSSVGDYVTNGGESSGSGGNGLIKEEKNDYGLVVQTGLDVLKTLKVRSETIFPTNINDVMIPGILRKVAIMFYNMIDTKSALYHKHEPNEVAIYKTLDFEHGNYQFEKSTDHHTHNESKLGVVIEDFCKYMSANGKFSKDDLQKFSEIKKQFNVTSLWSAETRRNAEHFVTAARDSHYQIRKVLGNTENILNMMLKNAVPNDNSRKLIAEYLTSFVFCSDNVDLQEQTNTFLSFLVNNVDKESDACNIQKKGLSWILSISDAQNQINETTKFRNLLEAGINKVKRYENKIQELEEQPTAKNTNLDEDDANFDQPNEELDNLKKQLASAKAEVENLRTSIEEKDKKLKELNSQLEKSTNDLTLSINKYNAEKLGEENEEINDKDNADINGTIPPPPPLQQVLNFSLASSQKTANKKKIVEKKDNIVKPVTSLEAELKNVKLKKITYTVVELTDPKNPTEKIKLSDKDLQKTADDWYLDEIRLESEGKTDTDEYKIIKKNLEVLLTVYNTKPNIKQNFLQTALSNAIKIRRQNLHMHDEEDDIEDDDWD